MSALWCPLVTPTILLGFLLPWRWGISSLLLQQIVATAAHFIWQEKLECTGLNFDAAFPVSLKCLYITVISGFICNGCKNCYVKYISKFIVNIKMLLNIIFSPRGEAAALKNERRGELTPGRSATPATAAAMFLRMSVRAALNFFS